VTVVTNRFSSVVICISVHIMKNISLVVGTRPNFMKAYPVYIALSGSFSVTLIHTGQHFSPEMTDVFFTQLEFPKPDVHFELISRSKAGSFDELLYINNTEYIKDRGKIIDDLLHADGETLGQLGEIKERLKKEFADNAPDLVVVFGDCTNTLASALAAKELGIKTAHVESGLRSSDLSMPEEINRILTDHISDYYFVTEKSGVANLRHEGIVDNVYLVGNTMIDTQKKFIAKAMETQYCSQLGVNKKEFVLITLHRPGNVDDLDRLREIFDELLTLSETETLVYPIHPRTRNKLGMAGYLDMIAKCPNIILSKPLGYLEFTCLVANSKYVVTDSGGIQEETSVLGIPCFTLRSSTERPSTLIEETGTNQLIASIRDIKLRGCTGRMELCDGNSAGRIKDRLIDIKIAATLYTTKPELDEHIAELKKVYDIPVRYIQDGTLGRTKNREVVINKQVLKVELPAIWSLPLTTNTTYQVHTLNAIIQSQLSLFAYKTYDTNILEYCVGVVESWVDNNEKLQYPIRNATNPNWQDMAAAKRLDNIILVYELANRYGIATDRDKFRTEILYHINWLQLHLLDPDVSRNHVLFIARSTLLGSGAYIKHFGALEQDYASSSVSRFYRTVMDQVDTIDALSKEHSTNYHILYYRQLCKFCSVVDISSEVLQSANEEIIQQCRTLQTLCDSMYESLNYFVYPSTRFVQIGDTDDQRTDYQFGACAPLREFPGAGYIVYKKNDVHVSMSASCHSRFHKHMDELSINYFNECPVLVEGGRYSYEDYKLFDKLGACDKWRCSYFLSQRSKNGVTVDGIYYCFNSSERARATRVYAGTRVVPYTKDYGYGSGTINSHIHDETVTMTATNPLLWKFQNVRHFRSLRLREGSGTLLVEDKLAAGDDARHTSTRHFHFHADWEFTGIVKNKASFKHKKSPRKLDFTDTSGGRINYYFGQETPFIQGFTSSHELHKVPAPTLEVTNYFTGSVVLECAISIS